MFESLLKPGKIGTLELKNRIIMTPANLAYATPEGMATPRLMEFYRRRAAGGVGLIVVGAIGVDPARVCTGGVLNLSDDSKMESLGKVVRAIHEEGGKAFPQLWHAGAYAMPVQYNGQTPAAPSSWFCKFSHAQTHELTEEEIADIVGYFGAAAARAKAVGFDGIELVGSAGYLIAQFLSSATNRRTDRYGGDLNGRMTFLREVYAAVRAAVGEDMPVSVRLAGNDFVPNGNTNDDCIAVARELERLGVNALNITGGWHETLIPQVTMDVPRGTYSYLAKRVKREVSIPVAACNRMDAAAAEEVLSNGDADFIGICRGLIADAELVNKLAAGRPELIRPCIGCNQGCMDNIFKGRALTCLTNTEAGREAPPPASKGKKVLVIGAGVAGMEYALRAAEAGADVTVWEKSSAPGGQMDIVSTPPGRQDFAELPAFQYRACVEHGVSFRFGMEATADAICAAVSDMGFHSVVVATGASPIMPRIPVEDGAAVVSAWDVLRGTPVPGKNIVVVGGGAVGVETALLLAEKGTLTAEQLKFLFLYRAETPERLYELLTQGSRNVTIVEMMSKIGADIGASTKWIMMGNLARYHVDRRTDTKVVSVERGAVVVENTDGATERIEADAVVMAIGSKPENALAEALRERLDCVTVVGDAVSPRKALDAIRDAFDGAKNL